MGKTLYDRVVERLEELGKSAREVSIEAGLGPDGIRDIKRGRSPGPHRLKALAAELGCSVDDLLGGPSGRRAPAESSPPSATTIPEIDGTLGAGLGGATDLVNVTGDDGYTISRDAVLADWSLPEPYLTTELRVRAPNARIIAVVGDSMTPTLLPGDRVMVNTADRRPSPPGIFALWDGLGIVVKRVEHIPGSSPPTLRIISDNPHHAPYERTLDEAHLIGRLVWYARRM